MAGSSLFVFFNAVSDNSKWDLRWTVLDPMQPNTIQYNSIQFNTIQYNQYNPLQSNTIQYNTGGEPQGAGNPKTEPSLGPWRGRIRGLDFLDFLDFFDLF